MKRIKLPLNLIALTLAFSTTVKAAPTNKAADNSLPLGKEAQSFDSSLPTNISSDSLTLKSEDRVFVYSGNVVVTQGDMKLTADTLEGTYNEQNQIQKLVAKNNVKINKVDIDASGGQALYDATSRTVTLIDNPQVNQGESILTADKIRLFLDENRSQAEGRVRVTLVDKDKKAVAANATQTPQPALTPNDTPPPSKPEQVTAPSKAGAKSKGKN